MKKKIIISLCLLLTVVFCFAACSQNLYAPDKGGGSGSESDQIQVVNADGNNVIERKIIYTVSLTLQCDKLSDAVKSLKASLESGEWFDSEVIYLDSAKFVARIKSERLDTFVEDISKTGTVHDFRKTATDISLEYSNKQVQIDALNAERTRLLELLENASFNESLTINTRITNIDAEILKLERSLSSYDQSVDFSTVTINLTEKYIAPVSEDLTFGQQFVKVLKDSFKALGTFFKFLFIALTAIFPFALVFAPITVLIIFLVKRHNKKAKSKAQAQKKLQAHQQKKPIVADSQTQENKQNDKPQN